MSIAGEMWEAEYDKERKVTAELTAKLQAAEREIKFQRENLPVYAVEYQRELEAKLQAAEGDSELFRNALEHIRSKYKRNRGYYGPGHVADRALSGLSPDYLTDFYPTNKVDVNP